MSFWRSKGSLWPSRLTTRSGTSSQRSYVVNLNPQLVHSRRRLMASLLSEGLESTTFDSSQPHLGQRI